MATKEAGGLARCAICDINFPKEHDLNSHLMSKKHTKTVEAKSSVFVRVTGMDVRKPADEQEVLTFVKQYGKVKQSYLDAAKGSWIISQFEELDSVDRILSVPKDKLILGNGKEITVSKKRSRHEEVQQLKEQNKDVPKDQDKTPEFDLSKMFKNCFSIEEQIDVLMKEIDSHNTEEDEMRRQAVCDEILDVLTAYLPHTTLDVFGSSVNGLGVKASDIDLTILFNLDKYDETSGPYVSQKPFPYIDEPEIKAANLQNTETKVINVQGLKNLVNSSLANAIILISKLLGTENTGFTKLVNRTGGRVPVIKAYHGGADIPCDITCENRLGPRNSQLLKFYQEIDPRVQPLMRTLRVLGTLVGYSGSIVSRSPKMTNYCLYMLVIYYLQNTQPPVLPTVEELANLADESEKLTLDGYDATYTRDLSRIRLPTNYSSLKKLLCDFFIFFADFDFSYYVICPRNGRAIPILEIDQFCQFKEGFSFKPKVVHIQDPFELDKNIAGNGNKYILEFMLSAFRKCRQLILEPTFGEPTLTGDWGISALNVKVDSEGEAKGKANDKYRPEVRARSLPNGKQLFYFNMQMQDRETCSPYQCWQPLTHRANVIALKQWWTYRMVNAIICLLEGPFQGIVIPEAENLEDLVAEYGRLETQRLAVRAEKVRGKNSSTIDVDPPAKRLKLEKEETSSSNGATEREVPKHGVLYCPVANGAATNVYNVKMQKSFSPEQYGKKQLLFSAECKLYSRVDDLFFARNKIRSKMVQEEGMEHVYHNTDQFCAFETKVTHRALEEVAKTRPAKILAVESEPVMEFHTHISVINDMREQISLEIEMEDDRVGIMPKNGGFCEALVLNFRNMLTKLMIHFPMQ